MTPGSKEAKKAGCRCPVVDNYYGRGHLGDGEQFGWVTSGGCPLHGFNSWRSASEIAPPIQSRLP